MGALTHNGEVLQNLPANASQINFDKTGTNLNSTQTENAIKEVNTKVNTNTADIAQLMRGLMGEVASIATGVTLYKQGKFRMLVVYGATSPRDGVIANVPASDRPKSQFVYPSFFIENDTKKAGYLQINANGNVYIRALDDVTKDNCPVYGSYCYHII